MSFEFKLTKGQKTDYTRDGFLILKSFYDIEREIAPIHQAIYEIIGLAIKKHNLSIQRRPFTSASFDDGYQQLIKIDRSIGGEIYDAVKQIPAFLQLLSTEKHLSIFKQIFESSFPGIAAAGYGIRIDNPREDRFRAKWHQEYLSQLRSLEAFTMWSPLIDVTKDMGPVEICPGSHTEGILKVSLGDENPKNAYSVTLADEDRYVGKYTVQAPLLNVGDLMLVDWLTIHRSGKNVSDRSRWSMQMRYFNFNNEQAIKLGWCGSFSSGVDVSKIHPNYIEN